MVLNVFQSRASQCHPYESALVRAVKSHGTNQGAGGNIFLSYSEFYSLYFLEGMKQLLDLRFLRKRTLAKLTRREHWSRADTTIAQIRLLAEWVRVVLDSNRVGLGNGRAQGVGRAYRLS